MSAIRRLAVTVSTELGRRAATAVAVGVLASLAFVPAAVAQQATNSSDTYRQLNLFGDVFERVRAEYVEEVGDQQLIEAAINGMLNALDPHSSFLNSKNYRDMRVQTKGEFGGLGIEVTMENGFVKVVSPIDETPAARAGLKPGDYITHLNGEAVLGLNLGEAVEKMRGPVGSKLKLTIRREAAEPFDVTIERAVIRIRSARARVIGDVGYVRVTTFNEQTTQGLQAGVKDIQSKLGDKAIGYVLDLRNNPGGLLKEAISVSDAFLDKGEIVSTRGRDPGDASREYATPGDVIGGLPLIVLINGGSASASEIVAGALQDHRRAVILGTRSFGKGSVQTIVPLSGEVAIRLTTARYYTPSGRSIQKTGIDPDMEGPVAKIERVEPSQKPRREADLPHALGNADSEKKPRPADAKPEGEKAEGDDPPAAEAEDYQLARAIDLLRGIHLYRGRIVN